jgi:Beta-propeller repeat
MRRCVYCAMAILALAGCDLDQNLGNETVGAGGGATASTSTGAGTGGGTTSTGAGAGGGGGMGGGGGAGGGACVPLSTVQCYTGLANTEDVGPCVGGTKTCDADGTGYGECVGEVTPGFEDCSTVEDEDCNGATPACPVNTTWSKLFGDADTQAVHDVAVDAFGNVFAIGYLMGSMNFGAGPLTSAGGFDIFVAKLDAAGDAIWSKRFGNAGYDVGNRIAVDSAGNVVVAGVFEGAVDFGAGVLTSVGDSDIFVAKLDSAGDTIWSGQYGGAGAARVKSLAVDGADSVVIAGEFEDIVDFGDGPHTNAGGAPGYDGFVLKLDAGGNTAWSKAFGGVDSNGMPYLFDTATDVAVDASGNVVLVGYFHGTVDFGCAPLSLGNTGALVVKLDSDGGCLWSKAFADTGADAVAVDGSGDVLLAGSFSGIIDFGTGPVSSGINDDLFLVKFDAAGAAVWAGNYDMSSPGSTIITDIAVDSSGSTVMTGRFEGELNFGGAPIESSPNLWDVIFLVKIDPEGSHVWTTESDPVAAQPGGIGFHVPEGVAVDAAGYIALGGVVAGVADVGSGLLMSAGYDALVARIAP